MNVLLYSRRCFSKKHFWQKTRCFCTSMRHVVFFIEVLCKAQKAFVLLWLVYVENGSAFFFLTMMRDCICPSIPDSTKIYDHEKRMAEDHPLSSVLSFCVLRSAFCFVFRLWVPAFAFRFLFCIPLLEFWLYFVLRSFAREHSACSLALADPPDLPINWLWQILPAR